MRSVRTALFLLHLLLLGLLLILLGDHPELLLDRPPDSLHLFLLILLRFLLRFLLIPLHFHHILLEELLFLANNILFLMLILMMSMLPLLDG